MEGGIWIMNIKLVIGGKVCCSQPRLFVVSIRHINIEQMYCETKAFITYQTNAGPMMNKCTRMHGCMFLWWTLVQFGPTCTCGCYVLSWWLLRLDNTKMCTRGLPGCVSNGGYSCGLLVNTFGCNYLAIIVRLFPMVDTGNDGVLCLTLWPWDVQECIAF